MTAAVQAVPVAASSTNRWVQLLLGVIAMMAISSPQYVWTLFTGPLNQQLGTTLAELQWTVSLLVILQTWFSPFQAYLVDRFGPRLLISIGALLSGGSWILAAWASNLWALYLTYGVIGGFGTGIIYVGIIGLMVRWFPDRRGLATGLAAAGYGFGAFFTSFPIDSMIKSSGYAYTLVVWGCVQAVIGVLAAQWLHTPPGKLCGAERGSINAGRRPAGTAKFHAAGDAQKPDLLPAVRDDEHDVHQRADGRFQRWAFRQGFRRRQYAGDGHGGVAAVADTLTPHQRTDAAVLRLGFRPDRPRMHHGAGIFAGMHRDPDPVRFINQPALFVVLTGLVFFGWGEIFSLFPSTLTDTFGPKFAATNYGFLYIAQGVGSILAGPAAAFLKQATGSWTAVFIVVAVLDAVTAVLAITVLKSMRQRHMSAAGWQPSPRLRRFDTTAAFPLETAHFAGPNRPA